ncbi:MAG: histidinol-phosphate transaminase [Flavobacteriaceae bacterium]
MSQDIQSIFKAHLKTAKKEYEGGKNIPLGSGHKIYKLSSNENPLGPSPKAIEAIKGAAQELHRYPDQTDVRVRKALANYFGNKLPEDRFLLGNSGSEIIDLIGRAFLEVGDEVIISNPCFLPYKVFSQWYGAKVVDVPLMAPDYNLDIKGILNAVTPRTKIIFLTSPNNPTGTYIPKSDLDNLLSKLPGNIVVILDEVYWQFVTAPDYVTALPFVEEGFPIIAINSFSKVYGLAGLRVGYCYSTKAIIDYMRQLCKPFLLPSPSIEGAIAALEDSVFLEETLQTVHKGRQFLEEAFNTLQIRYWPSQANFFLIDPPIPENDFVEALMEYGIMVRPVSNFGATGKVRITVGTMETNQLLIKAMESICAKCPQGN